MTEAQPEGVPEGSRRAVTHRRVFAIAVPIVLSNATVPILGAVDTGVVGQMGEAAPIGAVGIGAIVLTALYWVFGFLRMATVGLTGQAEGAGDRAEVCRILTRALLIAGAGAVFLIVLQVPLFWAAFSVAPASTEVEALAKEYMSIRIWAAPAAIGIYAVTGWLIALERTRGVLLLQLWMNGLNIGLDLWFVLSLGWGVPGVAYATLIAEWTGLALGLWLCRDAFRGTAWRVWAAVFDRVRLLRLASASGDIVIRSVLLEAIFISFLFLGARLGDVPLAANQILLQFLHITAYAMDGFAFAAEALVANAAGARNRAAVRKGALYASIWAIGICLMLGLAFGLLGGFLIDRMATAEEVRAEARHYLIWMAIAPIAGCAAWMFDGIFIGATRTRDMRNMMIVSALVYAAALSILLPLFGNHGLWLALLVSFVARGASLGARYPALERSIEA